MLSVLASFSGFWLTAIELAVAFAAVTYFFVKLFQGRISMRWLRERLWWF